MAKKRVAVIVLGEVGRSPRMQYHALSLADIAGANVDLIGYAGCAPHPAIMNNKNIRQVLINPRSWTWLPTKRSKLLFLLFAPFKVLIQTLILFWTLLFSISRPDYFLVQNPPTIPTLIIVKIVCILNMKSKLIIDWHNFGYTLMALSMGNNIYVRLARWIERTFGRNAYAHFCVSKAMKEELEQNWGIRATVLYDRPPSIFQETALEERHELFKRLIPKSVHVDEYSGEESTPFTVKTPQTKRPKSRRTSLQVNRSEAPDQQEANANGGFTSRKKTEYEVSLRDDRPALIISSTSWTEDEDFGILLDAITRCDELAVQYEKETGERFPHLLFIITGRGPQRQFYEEKIASLTLSKATIQTKWLEAADYPKLLGSADLGVCLHYSSSKLDLPMKIVDMFGCGLPVCAVHYRALSEQVKHGYNGLFFSSSQELASQLFDLFKKFPRDKTQLDEMRRNLRSYQAHRWDHEWTQKALPVFARQSVN